MTNTQRFVRFKQDQSVKFGSLNDGLITILAGNIFDAPQVTAETCSLNDVTLLAPVTPQSIFCVGLNYRSHAGERARAIPGIFTKPPTAIIGPEEPIPYPQGAQDLHHEGEMVIVMGKHCFNVSADEAPNYIFGITCGNDMSERHWQKNDLQWFRAKGSDGFGPIGPCIVTGLDYNNLLLETRLNGETVQSERTSQLLHPVAEVISFISQTITINPGDIIFTGTPGKTKAVNPGDIIEVELEGVGVLKNQIVVME